VKGWDSPNIKPSGSCIAAQLITAISIEADSTDAQWLPAAGFEMGLQPQHAVHRSWLQLIKLTNGGETDVHAAESHLPTKKPPLFEGEAAERDVAIGTDCSLK
jgi:hypothetical protein